MSVVALFVASALAGALDIDVDLAGLGVAPLPVVAAERKGAHDEATLLFKQRCAVCHGARGQGDGALATTMMPKPRDLSSTRWQSSVDDARLAAVVLGGGATLGLSPLMPGNADLKGKPAVVAALVDVVRGLRRRGVARIRLASRDVVAVPDAGGSVATTSVADVAGTVVVEGYFDADEDGRRGKEEVQYAAVTVVVGAEPVRVQLRRR